MLVKDWMTTFVHTVAPESSFSDALNLLKEKKIKHLPVVKAGAVVGILSDRDIKEFAPSKATTLDIYELNYLLDKTKIKDVMKSPVITVPADMPVEEAAMLLYDRGIGCVPVVEGGKLVGILSDRDIFRILVDITGARRGGVRISLSLEDRSGSIKEVADIIRKHGFRLQSILSSHEKAGPGQRYVVIRAGGDGNQAGLKADLTATYNPVRIKP